MAPFLPLPTDFEDSPGDIYSTGDLFGIRPASIYRPATFSPGVYYSTGDKSRGKITKSTNCLLLTLIWEKFGPKGFRVLFSACLETNSRSGDGLLKKLSACQELMREPEWRGSRRVLTVKSGRGLIVKYMQLAWGSLPSFWCIYSTGTRIGEFMENS